MSQHAEICSSDLAEHSSANVWIMLDRVIYVETSGGLEMGGRAPPLSRGCPLGGGTHTPMILI